MDPNEPQPEPYQLDRLAARPIDYTTAWAEHAASAGRDISAEATKLALYVDAFNAVESGALKLPGVDNGKSFVREIRRWIRAEFAEKVGGEIESDNVNHKAFYAFIHRKAVEFLRDGSFDHWQANTAAADVLDDWISDKLVQKLVFPTE